jgi:hypothetical protein
MVDNTNPVSQFHPYQPVRDVPASERPSSGLKDTVNKARDWGRQNPGTLLGGLAAAAIGIGLMRRMR